VNEPIRAGARSTERLGWGLAVRFGGAGETVKHGGWDANTPSAWTA